MSTAAPTQPQTAAPIALPGGPVLYRLTVDEYERIGAMLDDPRVELIDGCLVKKMPKKPEHKWATKKALEALDALLPPGWTSQKEEAMRISTYDEPEPDIGIVRGSDDDWKHRNPGPADVALLVEVSDSTLAEDRKMAERFARAGIPVYWIINLVDGQVDVFSNPGPSGYGSFDVLAPPHVLRVVIDAVEVGEIPVADVLP